MGSPANENVGFMAYNALAGGVLTGKYLQVPRLVAAAAPMRLEPNRSEPTCRVDAPEPGLSPSPR